MAVKKTTQAALGQPEKSSGKTARARIETHRRKL
jgi:hypothetical protein